jgi:hypothetical protein
MAIISTILLAYNRKIINKFKLHNHLWENKQKFIIILIKNMVQSKLYGKREIY